MNKKIIFSSVFLASLLSFWAINYALADEVDVNIWDKVKVSAKEDNVNVNISDNSEVEWWYKEIDCSSDPVFSEQSCHQCFVWWEKSEWEYIWFMEDTWINSTDYDQLMYEEQQKDPKMINLASSKVEWEQVPSKDNFWKLTDELKALHNAEKEGFFLKKWNSVRRIQMELWSAYKLKKNEAPVWENIWVVVFPIIAHNILDDGSITPESEEHHECVLFKSAKKDAKVAPKTPKKKLPKTGPAEFLILLILAMVLAFGVLRYRKS